MNEKPNDRLKKARIEAGYKRAVEAIRAFGFTKTTYQAHEAGQRGLTAGTAGRYAKAFKVSPEWLLYGMPTKSPSSTALETNLAAQDTTIALPTVLDVRAGHWLAVEFMDEYQDDGVRVPYCEEYKEFDQFAVKVVGDSINKFAQDGDRLVCATIESGIQLVDGDHVIVEATRNGGAEVEATVKQIKMMPDGLELWPNSTNPMYTGPVKLEKNGDEVRLRGVVLATRSPVRPRPARAVRLP